MAANPTPQFDIGPLSWVKTEIEHSLTEARSNIQKLVTDPNDAKAIKYIATHLHQVTGALSMVGLGAATRFNDEIEKLVATFENAQADPATVASRAAIINKAISSLSTYLDSLMSGEVDRPMMLAKAYITVNRARGANDATEADLFSPDLSVTVPSPDDTISLPKPDMLAHAVKQRRGMYQAGLLKLLRDKDMIAGARDMRNAALAIEALQITSPSRSFWYAVGGFFDAIAANPSEAGAVAVQLFGKIDQQIKLLIEGVQKVPEKLFRDLLLVIGKSNAQSERVRKIRELYRLDALLAIPEVSGESMADDRLKATLRTLKDQLQAQKDSWLKFTSGNRTALEPFVAHSDALLGVSKQQPNRELTQLIQILLSIGGHLRKVGLPPSEALSLEVATALLFIETSLENYFRLSPDFVAQTFTVISRLKGALEGTPLAPLDTSSNALMDDITKRAQERMLIFQVGQEIQVNLHTIEAALDAFFRDSSKLPELLTLPQLFSQIQGALMILELEEAATLNLILRDRVSQFASGELKPQGEDAEIVAEGISCLGLYINALQQGTSHARDVLLPALIRFGLAQKTIEPEKSTIKSPIAAIDIDVGKQKVQQLYEDWKHRPEQTTTRDQLREAVEELKQDAELVADKDVAKQSEEVLKAIDANLDPSTGDISQALQEITPEKPAETPAQQTVQLLSSPDAEIDKELLEIFLEEAIEVISVIRENYDLIGHNPNHKEAMITIRRGFHTLKGSGRMVGLTDLGEVAWDCEQVMNKWLKEEKPASKGLIGFIDLTSKAFKVWIQSLQADGKVNIDGSEIAKQADLLKNGKEPALLEISASSIDATQESAEKDRDAALPQAISTALAKPSTEITAPIVVTEEPQQAASHETPTNASPDGLEEPSPELTALNEIPFDLPPIQESKDSVTAEAISNLEALDSSEDDISIGPVTLPLQLFNIYIGEVDLHMATLEAEMTAIETNPLCSVTHEFMRAAHTLTSSSRTTGFEMIADISFELEKWLNDAIDFLPEWDDYRLQVTRQAVNALNRMAAELHAHCWPEARADIVVALEELREQFKNAKRNGEGTHLRLPIYEPDFAESAFAQTESEARPSNDEHDLISTAPTDQHEHHVENEFHGYLTEENVQPSIDTTTPMEEPLEIVDSHTEAIQSQPNDLATESPSAMPIEQTAEVNLDLQPDVVEDTSLVSLMGTPAESLATDVVAITDEIAVVEEIAITEGAIEPSDTDTATEDVISALEQDVIADETSSDSTIESILDEDVALQIDEHLSAQSYLIETTLPAAEVAEAAVAANIDDAIEPDQNRKNTLEENAIEITEPIKAIARDAGLVNIADVVDSAVSGLEQEVEVRAVDLNAAEVEEQQPLLDSATEQIDNDKETYVLTTDATETAEAELADGSWPLNPLETPAITDAPVITSNVHEPLPQPTPSTPPALTNEQDIFESGKERRTVVDDIDTDLLPIFLDEAREIIPQVSDALRRWRTQPDNHEPVMELARHLHTLKGSARMAGLMRLGELAHVIEARILEMDAIEQPSTAKFDGVDDGLDRFSTTIDRLSEGELSPTIEIPAISDVAEDLPAPIAVLAAARAEIVAEGEKLEGRERQSLLRVNADQIDRFVDEAGELAIARSRIDLELMTFKRSLHDLSENILRMKGQLREIEIQAETQIQSRLKEAQEHGADFDPLEFDRFSRTQELTRFLAESLNDVITLQISLQNNIDEAEAALLQQARLNRDLQQGLMAVRLVPMGNLQDRFYRLIRQTAKELGKKANLEFRGVRVEIDRSVLEKITAPFEHLLRNAIAHGLEMPEDRVAVGKPEIGEVTIDAQQVGNEIILTLADDGAGLNFVRIREKAIEQGLLQPHETVDESQLTQYIFMPGFSTAKEVTQVAGRGVGMDVVKNEIVSLGGRIDISSTPGKGTTFTIALPLTLAVTQAVMVMVGEAMYAIPSVMIEQVQEYKGKRYEPMLNMSEVEWKGNVYPLRSLEALLGGQPSVSPVRRAFVLLLKSAQQRAAVQVDEIIGNREIVVKTIGPQLARLPGVAGATVQGAGQVVLILNPVQLVYRDAAVAGIESAVNEGDTNELTSAASDLTAEGVTAEATLPTHSATLGETISAGLEASQAERVAVIARTAPLVMVVDDSLTVRKITSRMLTRERFEVITAKDGVDGLQQLQDVIPDIILLDIEMPRMDGFEFARNVRADAKTKSIPIIMITSRTAEKHRNFALEIGVNEYMGKPYQEEQLLQMIRQYTQQSVAA